jgi:cell division transport system permease protein
LTLLQAVRYFLREATINLLRGFRVSLVAVLTIAVSLLLGGAFLLAGRNLSGSVARWRGEMRVVIYLKPETTPATFQRLATEAAREPWAAHVEAVSAAAARERFQHIFPTLADLVQGWQDEPLPASLEIGLSKQATSLAGLDRRLGAWRQRPEVAMVDDDREWLSQLETVISIVRGVGLVLGGVLLGAAVFTIGSVIRLTAYLHHEEIAVMRLVGATEFFIRGPFYAEGVLQGLLGGGLASGGLYAAYALIHSRRPPSLFTSLFAAEFLTPAQLATLISLGALAGLLGAISSLRRELPRS